MPGFAFHNETRKKLAATPQFGTLNGSFAGLGAMGPDVFQFLPPSKELVAALADGTVTQLISLLEQEMETPGSLPQNELNQLTAGLPTLLEIWAKPVGTIYSVLFSQLVLPFWPAINDVSTALSKLATIVQAQDTIALAKLLPSLPGIMNEANDLITNVPTVLQNLQTLLSFIPILGPWMEANYYELSLLGQHVPAQDALPGCRLYEFLRWHKSGTFANTLANPENSTNANRVAFNQGWQCHIATSVTAEPFICNIVGGPYRTHWWRNMLVQNFVDSWTFGFAETAGAVMAGDDPTPAYESWDSLCSANIQGDFDIGNLAAQVGPGGIPLAVSAMAKGLGSAEFDALLQGLPAEVNDIAAFINRAIGNTYARNTLPSVGATFGDQAFQSAYIGAFAVYWFMTGGTGPLGNNLLGDPPSGCGSTPPTWMTSGTTPSPAQAGLDVAGAICALILAIIAVLLLLAGDVVLAAAALLAALNAPIVDWDTAACNLFWFTKTFFAGSNAIRDILIYSGLAYPPPVMLGGPNVDALPGSSNPVLTGTLPATDLTPDPNTQQPGTLPTGDVPPTSGVPLTRSNSLLPDERLYPAAMDTTNAGFADLDFTSFPLSPGVLNETAPTQSLIPQGKYPDLVFNATGLGPDDIMAGGTYPSSYDLMGDAVANATHMLQETAKGTPIPNYNLDADRGYGWLCWHPLLGSDPTVPPIQDQSD